MCIRTSCSLGPDKSTGFLGFSFTADRTHTDFGSSLSFGLLGRDLSADDWKLLSINLYIRSSLRGTEFLEVGIKSHLFGDHTKFERILTVVGRGDVPPQWVSQIRHSHRPETTSPAGRRPDFRKAKLLRPIKRY